MTIALVCVDDSVYGGVYYCSAFTTTGAQPTWTKLTVTGLADLRIKSFGVDKIHPATKQYVCALNPADTDDRILYFRNNGDWVEILNSADARTIAGTASANYVLFDLYVDPTVSGTVYSTLCFSIVGTEPLYVMKSVDYGANWTAHAAYATTRGSASVYAIGDNIWVMLQSGLTRQARLAYSGDGGATWVTASQLMGGASGNYSGNIDPYNPTVLYHGWYNTDTTSLIKSVYAAGAITSSVLDTGKISAGNMLFNAAGRIVGLSVDNNTAYTDNAFVAHTDVATDVSDWDCSIRSQNSGSTVIGRGKSDDGGMSCLSSETDTTYEDRSGSNHGVVPYTNSLPGTGSTSQYGVWFGELPATGSVYVYADEQGDITDIPDPDNLGVPMFGDRSSWRDYDADDDGDGTPLSDYHAQDIQEDTPQRHAPWSVPAPAADYGIVSDGTKWVISSDEMALVSDLHDPVTLDADAAVLLDLQGVGGQEIGLDVQNANTVFAGPAAAPANEPTFRALVLVDLPAIALNDLSDVNTAGVADGDVIAYDVGTNTWLPVPGADTSMLHEHVINEDHSAECTGAEDEFPTALEFREHSTAVYLNGLRQRLDTHYTEDVGLNGITFITPPEAGDELIIDYIVTFDDYTSLLLDSESIELLDSDGEGLLDSEGT